MSWLLFAVNLFLLLSWCDARAQEEEELPPGFDEIPEAGAPLEEEETSPTSPPQLEGTADIIVIGSGPGGTGFLYRFLQLRPADLSVLWFDKGLDNFLCRNWPEDLEQQSDVLDFVPREKLSWAAAYAWNAFGGGDAGQSGGPSYLGIDRSGRDQIYGPVDVFALRNNSVLPSTPATMRWERAFYETGFTEQTPLRDRSNGENNVGYTSSIRTADGRDRLFLAGEIRDDDNNNVEYVHARILKINHDHESTGQATGVTGIRLASDQSEVGDLVTWNARKAVILAGGIFNTFDLLVESGIGPEEYLEIRQVPEPWWAPNELVGKGVGDEMLASFFTFEPEVQDQLGAEPKLAAQNTNDNTFTYWSTGVLAWLRFDSYLQDYLIGTFLPQALPCLAILLETFFQRVSGWAIGIAVEPNMSLKAVEKLRNGTFGFDRNPLGVVLDDSNLEFTSDMCMELNQALAPLRRGIEIQKEVRGFSLARCLSQLLASLGVYDILIPRVIVEENIDTFTNNGESCNLKQLTSYRHFYGGTADVIDSSYLVDGTTNLYISDASVLRRLGAGAPPTFIMQEGMRVADAVNAGIDA